MTLLATFAGMATPYPVAEAVVRKTPSSSGLAIIISNDYKTTSKLETLSGTVKDGERMNATFQFLKFETLRECNVTGDELMTLLCKVSRYPSLPKTYKCIAFVFSGHGLDANKLYMQDGSLITVQSIVDSLMPKTAPQIGTIPKLFLIDACRGTRTLSEEAIVVPRNAGKKVQRRGGLDATLHIPPEGNFLIAYSTMPNYQSYELKGEGGLWMTSLAEKLRTSSESIQDILSETSKDLMEMFQSPDLRQSMMQPEYISRLHGRLCLQSEGIAVSPRKDPSTTAKDKAKNSKSKAPTKGSVSPKNTSPHGRQQKEGKSPMSSPSTSPQKQHSTKMSSSPFSAKEKIACYCRENDKPEAKYQCNPEGAKQYVGKVYLARTCGWVSGDPQPTKARAEEDAAAKLLQKLNI